MTYLALAENEIITAEGRQLSFDHLVDTVNSQETILRYSHGSFASSHIRDIRPDIRCEGQRVTKLTISTGETFLLLSTSEILTTENQWITVDNLELGYGMKTLTYNRSVKHPQLTPKIITGIETYVASFIPVVSFETGSDNLLLSVFRDENISMLIPLRPKKELASVSIAW